MPVPTRGNIEPDYRDEQPQPCRPRQPGTRQRTDRDPPGEDNLRSNGQPFKEEFAIGHGLEKSGRMFCCDHCAEQAGVKELRDRA